MLLVTPILLALAGAFLHRYPFGGDRIMVYAAPAVVLLIGAGTAAAWERLGRLHRLAPAALVLLFVPPVYAAAKAVVFPWPTADFAGASAYVERIVCPRMSSRATTGATSITFVVSGRRTTARRLRTPPDAAGWFSRTGTVRRPAG